MGHRKLKSSKKLEIKPVGPSAWGTRNSASLSGPGSFTFNEQNFPYSYNLLWPKIFLKFNFAILSKFTKINKNQYNTVQHCQKAESREN